MDSLLESALNAAALRPNCFRHPERPATSELYGIPKCRECVRADWRIYSRAFGTGCGPEAHAEAQESGRYQDEERSARLEYTITQGGKPK